MEAHSDPTRSVKFGTFELNVRSRELSNGPTRVRLQEQPFEILRMMLERPGDVVTREELRRRLWPDGTFVDFEHSLNAAVKRLRAALGDDADNPRFVETLPRRGYRFIARLGESETAGSAHASAAAPRGRLAVLPFSNLSRDNSQEYFSDGLTEEMIAQLGELCRGRIGVIARWSSMVFKDSSRRAREIGEALQADYLLEGSVRRDGDRVRITARLIEACSETNLWSETYERDVTDVLSVQCDVAARIARSLAMELDSGKRATGYAALHPAAYSSYLKGRYYWNKPGDEGLDQAITYYEQAIVAAPAFGAAHAARARVTVARAEYYRVVPREALVLAREQASRALAIDPGLNEAQFALAEVHRMLDWNWTAAESCYLDTIAANPSYETARRGYAEMLAALSRHNEAVRESERACTLDPLCLVVGTTAAWVRYLAGDYEAAIHHCRNTLDMDPTFVRGRRLLAAAYLAAGRPTEALAELEATVALADADPVLLSWLAHAKAVTGARADALTLVRRARGMERERYVSSYHLALAYAGLGCIDEAFDALDRACLDRDPAVSMIAVEPRLDPIRSDVRYPSLLQKIKLPTLIRRSVRL